MIRVKKYSNCCGASPVSNGDCDTADLGICPDCKEHCDYETEAQELITVELDKDLFERVVKSFGLTMYDYNVKKVEIKDDFFKEDAKHKELKKQSNQAYKQLKEYEFIKRNP